MTMVLEFILWPLAFLLGLGLMPLMSWLSGRGGSSGFIGSIVLWTAWAGAERVLLTLQADGTWREDLVSDDAADAAESWLHVAGTKLGISFEVDEDTVPVQTTHVNVDSMADEQVGNVEDTASWDVERGAQQSFVDLREDGDFHVPVPTLLQRLQGVGGIEETITTVAQALKEHGGDTTGLTRKYMILANVTLLICGFLTVIVIGT